MTATTTSALPLVDFCQRLIQADSTPGQERAAIEIAAQQMRDLGYDDVQIDRHGNLIGRVGPEEGPALVVDGHIDTIPLHAEERWSHHPLSGAIADGRMYGLGTSDMKGPIAAFIEGGGRLKRSGARLRGPVYMVASIAEEMTEGSTLRRSFDGRPIEWCVIAEATSLAIATAQRGRAKVAVEIRGESSHAANPWRGINAADLAVDVAKGVRALPAGDHPLLGPRDISLIDIRSEPYPSISTIPNWCLSRYDARFLPGETPESLLDDFRSALPHGVDADVRYERTSFTTWVGDDYEVDDYAAAWETSRDHELVRAAVEATGAELTAYRFCTNGSYFAGERGIPTIGYGPASPDDPHTVDESIPLDELEAAANGYQQIAAALLAE
ncbi:MAG TPA: M20/M25/M40 family metallo-hydrolase [Conexibacter sp.]|nr:M20/M25/M40 family metallo-hydrolase [Conexibacter sp.]